MMLDTIAWDCLSLRTPELGPLWGLTADLADGIVFISPFTEGQFHNRFALSPGVRTLVAELSLDAADYAVPLAPKETIALEGGPSTPPQVGPSTLVLASPMLSTVSLGVKKQLDEKWAAAFYECGIPFEVASSEAFREAVEDTARLVRMWCYTISLFVSQASRSPSVQQSDVGRRTRTFTVQNGTALGRNGLRNWFECTITFGCAVSEVIRNTRTCICPQWRLIRSKKQQVTLVWRMTQISKLKAGAGQCAGHCPSLG
jgi:hypothetical protein